MADELKIRAGAAEYTTGRIGRLMTPAALAKHAERGTGPKFKIVLGQATYSVRDLDAWIDDLLSNAPARRPYRRKRSAAASRNEPIGAAA